MSGPSHQPGREGRRSLEQDAVEKYSEAVSKLLITWNKALKTYDRDAQTKCVNEINKLANDAETIEFLTQERVLEVLALMISSPPRREEELVLVELAGTALCKVLAFINHSQEVKHKHPRRIGRTNTHKDIGDVYLCTQSVLPIVPKITRMIVSPMVKLLQEGSIDGQKTAAWLLHFLACSAPDGALNWTSSQRADCAKAMLDSMGGMFGDVRLSVLHALAMCMQRDTAFRADVAQAGGVPVFIRLLRDDDIALVTAAAGTLHCLVQDHQAYVNWVVDIAGVPELLQLLQRLPVSQQENHLALLQVIWTLEKIAEVSEANAKLLIDSKVLPRLFHIITEAHTVSNEIQAAAASALAGISMGRDNKEQRSKLRDEVISQLGVPVLEDFKENGCRELQLVATALMRFATPFHLQKCRMEPEAPKLGSVSEAAGHPSLSSSSALKLPLIQTQEHEVPEAPKFKGALAVRGALSNFVGKEALVIGIGNYDHISKCKHAVRDAQDVSKALELSGFRVLQCLDPSGDDLRASMAQFEQRATAGFLVCIFFVGHGVVFEDTHYLLPVDFVPPPCIKAAALQKEQAERAAAVGEASGADGVPGSMFLTKDDLRRVHITAGNLDAMMQRLSAKGVRHTLVIMDPTRTCDKTLSKGPKASKSVTLDVPGVAQEEGAPQPTSLAGEERQGDGKGDVAAAKAGAGAASAEAADRAGQPLSRNRDGSPQKRKPGVGGKGKATAAPISDSSPVEGPHPVRSTKGTVKPLMQANAKAKAAKAGPVAPAPEMQTLKSRMADQLGWSYDGVKASLLLWAAGPGSQSLGAGTSSTSTRNSLFTEQVLKFLFTRHLNLRQGIEQLVRHTREITANQQIPGYSDDGLIGLDFKMLVAKAEE